MKLIEADKVKRAMKNYWKAQVNKALALTDGDEANKRINSYLEHNHELLKAIDELPSAEPDTTTHDSISAETGGNDGDRTSGDCISRTQAIDTIEKRLKWTTIPDYYPGIFGAVRGWLNGLPSAQPEREKGEWVYNSPVTMKCNRCGLVIKDWDWHRFKICPNCGADMRGEGVI